MTLDERSKVVLTFARVLYVNGQSTNEALAAAERFGNSLGLRGKIMARWGELEIRTEDHDAEFVCTVEANPTGVDMNRVASTTRIIDTQLEPATALEKINEISKTPPVRRSLFYRRVASRMFARP